MTSDDSPHLHRTLTSPFQCYATVPVLDPRAHLPRNGAVWSVLAASYPRHSLLGGHRALVAPKQYTTIFTCIGIYTYICLNIYIQKFHISLVLFLTVEQKNMA